MSNLVLSAAPFSSDSDNNMTTLSGKIKNTNGSRVARNHIEHVQKRTIKNRQPVESKVDNMMEYIHNNSGDNIEEGMSTFNPPKPPTSIGAEKRRETDPNLNVKESPIDINMDSPNTDIMDNIYDNPERRDVYNDSSMNSSSDYLKKIGPLKDKLNEYAGVPQYTNQSELTQKLNYMIHLLEDQHDEKTGHVFEELVLYSFLGIFIIFVVDSFARAGKYVR